MDLIKTHWIRILYSFLLVPLIFIAIWKKDYVVGSKEILETFSYYGIAISAVALIITALEVLQNVYISRTLKKEITENIKRSNNLEKTILARESISSIDEITNHIDNLDFKSAHNTFKIFRRHCSHLVEELNLKKGKEDKDILTSIELDFTSIRGASRNQSPIPKTEKQYIYDSLLHIKQKLETTHTSKREELHAPT